MKYVIFNKTEQYFVANGNLMAYNAKDATFYTSKAVAKRDIEQFCSSDFVLKTITLKNYKKLMG